MYEVVIIQHDSSIAVADVSCSEVISLCSLFFERNSCEIVVSKNSKVLFDSSGPDASRASLLSDLSKGQ